MTAIPYGAKHLLDKQHFVIVSSLNKDGTIHTSAKGVIKADPKGMIYILDLYKTRTYRNIKKTPRVTLTFVDEHKFRGYSIEGRARVRKENSLSKNMVKTWHDKLSKRIARRVIRHVKGEGSGHEGIPEAKFPFPRYLIEVSVEKIVDLAPQRLKLE